jgi:putative ABC transport system substrate-binding protein
MMRRREVITLLGGAATTSWALRPVSAQAPRGKDFRIGFFGPSLVTPPPIAYYQAFLAELRDNGLVEGQNLICVYQAFDEPRGPFAAAAELIRGQPDLLVAVGPEISLQAIAAASLAVPVVFAAVNYDPLARGFISSLARPGGNITGVFFRPLELAVKQLEILTEAFPGRKRLAVLWDGQSADQYAAAESAAKSRDVELQSNKLEALPYDFDTVFKRVSAASAEMVLVLSGPGFTRYRTQLAELAIAHRLPSMFTFKHYVEVGGLMSYGVEFAPMYRRAGAYAVKILGGAKPADLPVEQASKFETVVNLKTAKAIGVELPTSILLRADQVIE